MSARVRQIEHAGETWVNVEDLRQALRDDDELLLKAGAMLKVASVDHHEEALEALRKAIAYFFVEATGALD